MSYKNNYELWNPALATQRPSQMSEIDIVLAQTYPHVAMLPYSSCCHCSYEEEEDEFMSPSNSTIMSDDSIRSRSTQNSNGCAGSSTKGSKIRSRLRKLLKSTSRSG